MEPEHSPERSGPQQIEHRCGWSYRTVTPSGYTGVAGQEGPDAMDIDHRPADEEVTRSGGVSARAAFDRATSDLRMEGIALDAEAVPELIAYRDGAMTISEACEALSRRHARG